LKRIQCLGHAPERLSRVKSLADHQRPQHPRAPLSLLGRPIAGQAVTFTLSIPGVPALTGDDVTDGSGTARYRTTIPAGATPGSGLGTAFVSTADYGDASGRISITIIE
jgi:hypothetical protein